MSLRRWRRHTSKCPYRGKGKGKGRDVTTKCACPIWCDGVVNGERVREPLRTFNWQLALESMNRLEKELMTGRRRKTVKEAVSAFVDQLSLESTTFKKYVRWLDFMQEYLKGQEVEFVDEVHLEILDGYRATRRVGALSWTKELQFFRQFFKFCAKRKWIEENPAKEMEMPHDPKPRHKVPYTADEISRILAASMQFGRTPYERLRAYAMILLMRTYALRISDVSTLRRDRVRWNSDSNEWEIFIHAKKNDEPLWMPVYPIVKAALDMVPIPRGAGDDCEYFFWSGEGDREHQVVKVERTLKAVFRASGVEKAHAHRFRHTLATELLAKGRTIEDVADILGDDPATVKRHYIKFSLAYRARLREALDAVHGTFVARENFTPVSAVVAGVNLVAKVGVEPTR